MILSIYSVVMSVVCGSTIILAIHLLRKKPVFLRRFGASTILFLYGICIVRLLFPFEFPFTKVVAWSAGLNGFYRTVYRNKVMILDALEINLAGAACFLWFAVALFLAVTFIYKYMITQKKIRSYTANQSTNSEKIIKDIQAETGHRQDICVCTCPLIEIPMSIGMRNKMILLPDKKYTDEALRYILKHECVHHYNHDLLTIFLVRLFCCIFWWNPLAYLLRNDVLQMLEIKCDLDVTRKMDDSQITEYLTTIVSELKSAANKAATRFGSTVSVQLIEKNDRFSAVERFKIVTQPDKRNSRVFQTAFLTLFTVLFFASYLFILQPRYDPPAEEINADGYVDISAEGAYLIKHKNGAWSYVLPDGTVASAREETTKVLIQDGIEIKEE